MRAKEIYQEFNIPSNLSDHMLGVAGVVIFLQEHWKGPEVNWDVLKKSALLHDLGNIVKFDLENYPELLGKELKNIEHWRRIKTDAIRKYGSDDHEVTRKMLDWLGVEELVKKTILNKSFGNAVQVSSGNDWYSKILLYADLRMLPKGLATLAERIEDVKKRMPKYANRPDFEELNKACFDTEKQIENNLDIPVSSIAPEVLDKYKEKLSDFEI
jgi:hypothetical protein